MRMREVVRDGGGERENNLGEPLERGQLTPLAREEMESQG